MKKSVTVTLGCVMSAVVLTGGCMEDHKRCVDSRGVVVTDQFCRDEEKDDSYVTHSSSVGYYSYHWYYGGSGYGLGSSVEGGSARPGLMSRISRGGFGHSAVSHASSAHASSGG